MSTGGVPAFLLKTLHVPFYALVPSCVREDTAASLSAGPDPVPCGTDQLLATVIPAFGYGTKGAEFWLRFKQVPRFSPSPTHTSEAEMEGRWEMATHCFDLQLTQAGRVP